MRYEGSPVKALPFFKKKDDAACTCAEFVRLFEGEQGIYEEEGRGWNARERTIIARTSQFLERSHSVKARFEELQDLLGPEDVDVDLRRILKDARDERGRNIFETVSSDGERFPSC